MKRWPEQILRLGTALLPDAQGEGQKESEMGNDEILVEDGKRYRYYDTLLAIYGEPVDEKGNPIDGEWTTNPKNRFCQLIIGWQEFLLGFLDWQRLIYIFVFGTVFGAIGLTLSGPELIGVVTTGASLGDLLYSGISFLAPLITFVMCGGSLLYWITTPYHEEEEPEE